MDEKDLELYLKAKRQQPRARMLQSVAVVLIGILVFLEAMPLEIGSMIKIPLLVLASALLAQGQNRWVSTTREDLLAVIERQINRDPEALRLLAERKSEETRSDHVSRF